jgi:glycosyltransferase involved in cell wall biosynthesis
MHILQITREFPPAVLGGVSYHAYNLARQFVERGHSVTVITSNSTEYNTDGSEFYIDDIDINQVNYSSNLSSRINFADRVVEYINNNYSSDSFDVVHSHEFIDFSKIELDALMILKVHTNLCKKKEYMDASQFPKYLRQLALYFGDYFLWSREKKLEQKSLSTSDKRIYISKLVKYIYQKEYNFEESKKENEIIHNGVDPSRFYPDHDHDSYWLFVGGTSKRKGYNNLIQSIANTNINIKIVGNYDTAKVHKNIENIEYLGRVDQDKLTDLYQNSKGLIHPANYEPFGNVVLESLASGRPVIISSAEYCGAAEIIDGNIGMKINPNNHLSIKNTLQKADSLTFSIQDCRSVARDYTWKKTANRTLKYMY